MLVREDTVFTGPHHDALNELGKKLAATYVPVHEFLAGLPSLAGYPAMTAGFEATAQFSVFGRDLELISSQSGVPSDVLAYELGKQSILANIPSYLRLSMLHYLGQWSIMALKLPPTAEAINRYVASYPKVPLDGVLGDVILRPTASVRAYFVYPAFVGAGIVTLVAGLALVAFMVRPGLGDETRAQYLMLAAFFAATCHSYTLLISFINAIDAEIPDGGLSATGLGGRVPDLGILVQARKHSQERTAFRTVQPRSHSSSADNASAWAPRVASGRAKS